MESRTYEDAKGRTRLALALRSDLTLEQQVHASSATWIDRQLLARNSPIATSGFGADVRSAMTTRTDHLVEEGLARRQGQRVIFARDLLATLRRRELDDAIAKLAAGHGLTHQPLTEASRSPAPIASVSPWHRAASP